MTNKEKEIYWVNKIEEIMDSHFTYAQLGIILENDDLRTCQPRGTGKTVAIYNKIIIKALSQEDQFVMMGVINNSKVSQKYMIEKMIKTIDKINYNTGSDIIFRKIENLDDIYILNGNIIRFLTPYDLRDEIKGLSFKYLFIDDVQLSEQDRNLIEDIYENLTHVYTPIVLDQIQMREAMTNEHYSPLYRMEHGWLN